MAHIRLDELDACRDGVAVFESRTFATPWRRLEWITLHPGQATTCGAPADGDAGEQGYVVLDGVLDLAARNDHLGLHAHLGQTPGWLLGPAGWPHELTCQGPRPARLVRIQVDAETSSHGQVQAGEFTTGALTWRDAIHGGSGRLATRHVLRPQQFASCWTFLDHAILGADSSLGYHYHDALEECFIVLAGTGLMTMDGQTFSVGPRSVVFQSIGQAHGLDNPNPEPLEFIRIAVALADATYTTVDLHDDLRQRRPSGRPSD